jgi:hypothetical protein
MARCRLLWMAALRSPTSAQLKPSSARSSERSAPSNSINTNWPGGAVCVAIWR